MTTTRRTFAIAGAAALVLLAIWYLALFNPQTKKLHAARATRAAAEQKVDQLKTSIIRLEALEKQIPADQKTLQQLDADIPDQPDLASALDVFHQVASSSGATVSQVTPSSPSTVGGSSRSSAATTSGSGPASITVSLSASGTYPQLTSFLQGLATMPRTFVIKQLSISGSEPKLSANVSGVIFYTAQ